jgi:MYXO-CTERM domain-containing protein
MAYRRSTQPEAGARMKLFWISMDTSTPWPWLAAALLAAAGYGAWRRISPRVAAAWSVASDEAARG